MVKGRRRWLRVLGWTVAGLLSVAMVVALSLWLMARPNFGATATGADLARIEQSPQWKDGEFRNRLARVDGPFLRTMREFFFGGSDYRSPSAPPTVIARRGSDYAQPPASGLRITWLGHSTLLLEIDGQRVLMDPVWGARASPFTFLGPKRFFAPPLPLSELPSVDVVLISHDHYDHLDVGTIRALSERGVRFSVPLGVGAHLKAWGVSADRITELDWWEADTVGALTLTLTPARHFSGRSLTDQGRTLWAGWSIHAPRHRVYYSGDTALDDAMVQIGERLGPFDLTMIEAGAYNAMWADVHLGPEQAVRAHQLVRGNVMLPVHWGLFDLALHGWTEPIERVLAAAEKAGVPVLAPRPGEMIEPSAPPPLIRWWPTLPWENVQQAPAFSTSVGHLMRVEP